MIELAWSLEARAAYIAHREALRQVRRERRERLRILKDQEKEKQMQRQIASRRNKPAFQKGDSLRGFREFRRFRS